MKIIQWISLLIATSLAVSCSQKQTVNPEILKEELFSHIDFLASDSLFGRQPGTPFDRVAAKYIKDYMEHSNLTLLAKNGYQFFEFIDFLEVGKNNSMSINGQELSLNSDYSVFPFSFSDTLSASVVFVGYGFKIESDSISWNDYEIVNVSNKWAMILRGDPDYDNPNSLFTPFSDDRYKAMVAKDNGAAGVIFVSGNHFDEKDELVTARQKTFDIGIPVVQLKREVTSKLLKPYNTSIANLEQSLIDKKKPSSFIVGATVCARTNVVTKKRSTQNIVGLIEGSHPTLKNHYVVIGAHFDHLGMGGVNSSSRTPDTLAVHNGADDNASGVSAILEIGQKFAFNKPKRSIVVVAFGAEEIGLLGSSFFTQNPIVPIDSIVAMINIDMIGRLNSELNLTVGGVKTSLESEEIIVSVNQNYGFNLALSPQGYGPSDHASFYNRNIPVLFFSTGAHVDYHTPRDVIDLINFDGLKQCTDFIYDITSEIANKPEKLTFQEAGPSSPSTRHGRDLKVRFGIMPDVGGANIDGLKVLAVNDNQPAKIAGINKGDKITAINGKSVGNIHDYMFRLQELTPGETVSVEFIRDGELKVVLLQL